MSISVDCEVHIYDMSVLRFAVFCCLLTMAVDADAWKPWRTDDQFQIEIISKNQTSIQARFRHLRKVSKYLVYVQVKFLADVQASYTKNLKGKRDRQADGYYYINTGDVLDPGTLYEISVHQPRPFRTIKNIDVITDCSVYTYSCNTSRGESCLPSAYLCDGVDDCLDKSDEQKLNFTCAVTLPERPTPPVPSPPPVDTPCMRALIASFENTDGEDFVLTDRERPSCDANGYFAPVKCDNTSICHCIHPLSGKVLKTQRDIDELVLNIFSGVCGKKSKKILARANQKSDDPVIEVQPPEVHLPESVGELAPFSPTHTP